VKLILAIVDDRDVDKVMTALTSQRISITHVSSTGGLLFPRNSTLLIGLDEQYLPQAMTVIAELAAPRQSYMPYTYEGSVTSAGFAEVQVGGFLSFVLDIEQFEQV
jgi:uncharacterized protein YaaQ